MAISSVIFLVFGLFIGVEEAIDISEALYWGAGSLDNGGDWRWSGSPFRLGSEGHFGERLPFWARAFFEAKTTFFTLPVVRRRAKIKSGQ